MRNIEMQTGFLRAPSCLSSCGNTRVLCAATVSEGVPPFLKGKGQGWLTAEYAMLPGSTDRRKQREYGKRDGRSVEIQRLIGRSLRACCDLTRMGERTIYLDCDVIQADGGTRTASITGAFVALCLAVIYWKRYISVGSLTMLSVFFVLLLLSRGVWPYGVWAFALAALGFARHRSNLERLKNGTENKINFHSKK